MWSILCKTRIEIFSLVFIYFQICAKVGLKYIASFSYTSKSASGEPRFRISCRRVSILCKTGIEILSLVFVLTNQQLGIFLRTFGGYKNGNRRGISITCSKWLVLSKPQENLPEAKPPENSWPPRPLVRAHPPLVEWRSHIVTGQEPSLSVKSEDTRRAPSFSSGNSHSSV